MFYPLCSKDGNLNGPGFYSCFQATALCVFSFQCRACWESQWDGAKLQTTVISPKRLLWAASNGTKSVNSSSKDGISGCWCAEAARGGGQEEDQEKGARQPGVWVSTLNQEWKMNTILEKWQGRNNKKRIILGCFLKMPTPPAPQKLNGLGVPNIWWMNVDQGQVPSAIVSLKHFDN